MYQRFSGSVTLASWYSTVGSCLWLIDSIINPLWTTALAPKRKQKNSLLEHQCSCRHLRPPTTNENPASVELEIMTNSSQN